MGGELVICHSGASYAERPAAINWGGQRLEVDLVEAQWRRPGEIAFTVRVMDGRRFGLVYNELQDDWNVIEI